MNTEPEAQAEPSDEAQHTKCAVCLKDKSTPLRRDEMGGYVCLDCVDKRLDELEAERARSEELRRVVQEVVNLEAYHGGFWLKLREMEKALHELAEHARAALSTRPQSENDPE